MDHVVAMLQGEGLSVIGTVCHAGKAEDQQGLVAKVRGQGVEGQGEGGPEPSLCRPGRGRVGVETQAFCKARRENSTAEEWIKEWGMSRGMR